MSTHPDLKNLLKERRTARDWSQQDLADRAGIARASVSAIEMGRLVPSAAAALALAAALDCRVEDLFQLPQNRAIEGDWAWPGRPGPTRYWRADVGGRALLFPVEETTICGFPHDGLFVDGRYESRQDSPPPSLVMACCDPAVGLLAGALAQQSGVRLLTFMRSSRPALKLLKQGLVHVAGLHLDHADGEGNARAVKDELGKGYKLIRAAHWEEGVVTAGDRTFASRNAVVKAELKWVGREPGSGARQCLDELLGKRFTPTHVVRDHRGVAEAVRGGWADAGVCLRLTGEEAGLRFLPLREEAYDLCFHEDHEHDPRLAALLRVIRSTTYRRTVDDLPGYSSRKTGQVLAVK
ncbi:MAG: substrate-binding domain-containing protein [Pirellulales bacterium]